MSIVRLCGITKKFGETIAVDKLYLEIERGELFSLIGPNGAGKTTTIKLIAGLLHPTDGKILIDGIDMKSEPESAKSRIGYIPDNPYIYDTLTGREFLEFIGRLYSMKDRDIKRRIDELFEIFEITEWGDMRSEGYSHGMRQRIVISSALIHSPELIIIDEPMVGLDPKSANTVKKLFREEIEKGHTIFMSTHTLSLAEEVCSKIGIINRGKLKAIGSLSELRELSARKSKSLEELYLEITETV